jgi:hypothetical protein
MSNWLINYEEGAYPYSEVIEAEDVYRLLLEQKFTGDVDDIKSIYKLED